MKLLREMKKRYLLRITLRDILGISGLRLCMRELSELAEAMTRIALEIAEFLVREKFGLMPGNSFSVLALGKLGAGELNYSSDIDIMTVFDSAKPSSTGVLTPYGVRINKIDSGEYFCRLTEMLTSILQTSSEDGTVYRVDLRLRPNGQKGPLSLPLASYRTYYESWGKAWERMALIRARPVAGDAGIGPLFLKVVEPFIWKRSVNFEEIAEIRDMKKKIDAIFDINDIKRGYGGIREIEFFAQTFQLIYGGSRIHLRTAQLLETLATLRNEAFINEEERRTLSEGYLFLRRVEHVLQMRDDMRTHTLPRGDGEMEILSRKTGFGGKEEFLSYLRVMRLKIRDMYNSLLGEADVADETLLFLKENLPESAVKDYLSFKGFRDPHAASIHLDSLKEQMILGKTLGERTSLRSIVPLLLETLMKSVEKDRALALLVGLLVKIGGHESYTRILRDRQDIREALISVFSQSSYLSRLLLSIETMEGIFEYSDTRADGASMRNRLGRILKGMKDSGYAMWHFRTVEEMKTGIAYLKSLDTHGMSSVLTVLADAIVQSTVRLLKAEKNFAVIAFGGFGASEMNFGSDLDLAFIGDVRQGADRVAGDIIDFLAGIHSRGSIYKVDMRLRPDGEKGVLVRDIRGYEDYYLKNARSWEIQSLLKARAVAGDKLLMQEFEAMRISVIRTRGAESSSASVREMRQRIINEVARESQGIDLRHGPGGIGEIDFLVQHLQMKHSCAHPQLIGGDVAAAIKKLMRRHLLPDDEGNHLYEARDFLKKIDTFVRLNEESVIRKDSPVPDIINTFLKLPSTGGVLQTIEDRRTSVAGLVEKIYERAEKKCLS
jgi:[glutamine synthetase] adenylyltransferase / [glutamine synthetase]-adenylyl-L-tyrosine phosphorylase